MSNPKPTTPFVKVDEMIGIGYLEMVPGQYLLLKRSKGSAENADHFGVGPVKNTQVEIKWWGPSKGYSIELVGTGRVLCTSRTDYSSDKQYSEPGFPIWAWDWLSGGNQYWAFETDRYNKFKIRNTFSGYYMDWAPLASLEITQESGFVSFKLVS